MVNTLTSKLNNTVVYIEKLISKNPFTKSYGLGRSLIALSTLSIFCFNNIDYLFNKRALEVISGSRFVFNQINFFGLLGFENLILAKVLSILILLWVISGYLPQISAFFHFWLIFSFQNAALYLDGGEQIATIMTLLLIPICLFDKRLNHWQKPKYQSNNSKLVGHLAFFFLSLQTSFIYLNTGIEKIYKISVWRDGTALYYIFKSSYMGIGDQLNHMLSFIINSKFIFFITWWVIFSHLILSYIIMLKRKKRIRFIYFGIIFHSMVAVFFGLYSFSLVMIGVIIMYVLPFDYYEKKSNRHDRKDIL